VALALPRLTAAAAIAATLVVDPFTGSVAAPPPRPPEGYDAQVTFDPVRAARRLYPAIDPATTVARVHPSHAHADLAARTRTLLADYAATDPELRLPDPSSPAQRLVRLLAQPLAVAEPFTSVPGQRTAYGALLDEVGRILPARG
jgi:F0F1-type ATP synthase beta subunit